MPGNGTSPTGRNGSGEEPDWRSGAAAHEASTITTIAPGTTGWTTITLPPGRYELICNIAGHYAAGMYAALDVVGNR